MLYKRKRVKLDKKLTLEDMDRQGLIPYLTVPDNIGMLPITYVLNRLLVIMEASEVQKLCDSINKGPGVTQSIHKIYQMYLFCVYANLIAW